MAIARIRKRTLSLVPITTFLYLLRSKYQRDAILAAFFGHGGDEFQSRRTMRFIGIVNLTLTVQTGGRDISRTRDFLARSETQGPL